MRDDVRSEAVPPPSGGALRLQVRSAGLHSWLGPTWAVLCGVLASNGFRWQSGHWLRLALLFLLVDAGWGSLWTVLAGTDWAHAIRRWKEWHRGRPILALPYTRPGTVGDRFSRWAGSLLTWRQEVLWPAFGSAARVIPVGLLLTALLAALLGPEHLLLSVGVLGLMQLGVIWERGRGVTAPGWDALIAVAAPWLAGHAAFGATTLPSASLALLFALAWGSAWSPASRPSRVVLVVSQLLSVTCLVLLRHPLAAGTVLLLAVPQVALLPWTSVGLPTARFARYSRPWLLVAMAVAALTL